MWPFSRKPRVPESIAVSLVGSASFALHAGWITYFLAIRSQSFSQFLQLPDPYGMVGGLYLVVLSTFLILFLLGLFLFKGRDCSGYREHLFWFFLASVVTFLILTVPGVLNFSLLPKAA